MNGARAILVFSTLCALPAVASEAPPAPAATPAAPAPKAPAKKPVEKAEPKPAAGEAHMVVTKDAGTGEVRPATAAEREQLLGRRPLAAREHKVVTLPDGTKMVELGDADMAYAVATKNPDGTTTRTCVHGDPNAAKAAAPAAAPPATPPAPKTADR